MPGMRRFSNRRIKWEVVSKELSAAMQSA